MKRIILSLVALMAVLTASAQSDYIVQTGKIVGQDGVMRFVEPKSTLVVDITIEKSEVIVGPYARYAQKYLGVRAPLTEKLSYRIVEAKVSLGDDKLLAADDDVAAPTKQVIPSFADEKGYARLMPRPIPNRSGKVP